MPKKRWFDVDTSLPITEKSLDNIEGLFEHGDPELSSLGQFLGFESDEDEF